MQKNKSRDTNLIARWFEVLLLQGIINGTVLRKRHKSFHYKETPDDYIAIEVLIGTCYNDLAGMLICNFDLIWYDRAL